MNHSLLKNDALECIAIIEQCLPIKAGSKTFGKRELASMDREFQNMANHCVAFFRLQPHKPEQDDLATLYIAMAELRKHYDLQDVDGDMRIPHSDVRGGQVLKPIDKRILKRIAQAARKIEA